MSKDNKEYLLIREEFDTQLSQVVKASGGIEITTPSGDKVDMILLAAPKGLYGADEFDDYVDPFKIDSILQCTETGKVYANNNKIGLATFSFDFIGTKKELRKLQGKSHV